MRTNPEHNLFLPMFLMIFTIISLKMIKKPCEACKAKNQRLKRANKKEKWPRESHDGCWGCRVILCEGDCFAEWHTNLGAIHGNEDTETGINIHFILWTLFFSYLSKLWAMIAFKSDFSFNVMHGCWHYGTRFKQKFKSLIFNYCFLYC